VSRTTAACAIRQESDAQTHTSIAPPTRRIVVAQGIQFHSRQIAERIDGHMGGSIEEHMGRYLKQQKDQNLLTGQLTFDSGTVDAPERIFYESPTQGVLFDIRFVDSKREFKRWLETPGVLVAYTGHARYGLGPCFGDSGMGFDAHRPFNQQPRQRAVHHAIGPVYADAGGRRSHEEPTEAWYDGEDGHTDDTGLFRMGLPYTVVPVYDDLLHRDYSPRLVPYPTELDPQQCDRSHLRGMVTRHARERLDPFDLGDGQRPVGGFRMRGPLHGTNTNPYGFYWGTEKVHEGPFRALRQPWCVLEGGWENTPAAPYDLGATNLACDGLVMVACESGPHFQHVLRDLKGWRGEAYMLDATGNLVVAGLWIYHLLSYPHRSVSVPWRELLDYAMNHANAGLQRRGQRYHMRRI
jgi:hypothetical protein